MQKPWKGIYEGRISNIKYYAIMIIPLKEWVTIDYHIVFVFLVR